MFSIYCPMKFFINCLDIGGFVQKLLNVVCSMFSSLVHLSILEKFSARFFK